MRDLHCIPWWMLNCREPICRITVIERADVCVLGISVGYVVLLFYQNRRQAFE